AAFVGDLAGLDGHDRRRQLAGHRLEAVAEPAEIAGRGAIRPGERLAVCGDVDRRHAADERTQAEEEGHEETAHSDGYPNGEQGGRYAAKILPAPGSGS